MISTETPRASRTRLTLARLRAALLCWALLLFAPTVLAQEVIVNGSVTQAEVSKSTLRAMFGMRLRKWPDDTPVVVFVLPSNQKLHIEFCKNILHVFPHQLERAWNRLVFSGTGQRPIEVTSEQEMRARVAQTPGAIGYLTKEMVDDSVRRLDVQD